MFRVPNGRRGMIESMPDQQAIVAPDGRRETAVALAVLAVVTFVCFYPLLLYFFSQDDFNLMYRARHGMGEMLSLHFGSKAFHFRPLTKVLYFSATHRLFGLNPYPYHAISMAMHLGNTLLVFGLLRRLRVSDAPAVVATAFFALNVAFLHVIGWITCIQQLMGVLFMLLSIYLAAGWMRQHPAGKNMLMLSLASYVLALLSLEQTFLTPVLILMIGVFGLTGRRVSPGELFRAFWPHLLLLLVYTAVRLFWKGMPAGGISRFMFGKNIVVNLSAYLSAMYSFWPDLSALIPYRRGTVAPSHFMLFALVVYNIGRLRLRHVVFALAFIALTLVPALPLRGHYFFYHTYVPAFGAIYLLALVLEDAFALIARHRLGTRRGQLALVVVAVLIVGGFSFWKVRHNEKRAADPAARDKASFVLRRAMIAGNAYEDLMNKSGGMTRVRRVVMVYGWPGRKQFGGWSSDTKWAFAHGYAIRLFFEETALEEVEFRNVWKPETHEPSEDTRVFFYSPAGDCYTYDEIMQPVR
jgi:hypothetical protein